MEPGNENVSSRSLGCPMHRVSESDLTYLEYLKVPELLKLQMPLSSPAHHDEPLFIIIHQAYELWFKLILHEMDTAIGHLDVDAVFEAHHLLSRVGQIMKLLIQQIHILETMRPVDFLQFRDHLKPASGFQSAQFREVEFLAGLRDENYLSYFKNKPDVLQNLKKRFNGPSLKNAYFELLRRAGFPIPNSENPAQPWIDALLPIYQDPSKHMPYYMISEALVDFDQSLALWREHHVRVVERIIGSKTGTGGSEGVAYLKTTTTKKCFPILWELRTQLGKESHYG